VSAGSSNRDVSLAIIPARGSTGFGIRSQKAGVSDSTCAPLDDPDIIPFPSHRITRTKILGDLINEYDTPHNPRSEP
jgi:hypothetical protein